MNRNKYYGSNSKLLLLVTFILFICTVLLVIYLEIDIYSKILIFILGNGINLLYVQEIDNKVFFNDSYLLLINNFRFWTLDEKIYYSKIDHVHFYYAELPVMKIYLSKDKFKKILFFHLSKADWYKMKEILLTNKVLVVD